MDSDEPFCASCATACCTAWTCWFWSVEAPTASCWVVAALSLAAVRLCQSTTAILVTSPGARQTEWFSRPSASPSSNQACSCVSSAPTAGVWGGGAAVTSNGSIALAMVAVWPSGVSMP